MGCISSRMGVKNTQTGLRSVNERTAKELLDVQPDQRILNKDDTQQNIEDFRDKLARNLSDGKVKRIGSRDKESER